MKLTPRIRKKVLLLREEGLSYAKIAKRTKISCSSVIKIIKESQPKEIKPKKESTLEAWIFKLCPNPRVVFIHFGDKDKWAKCVVRADKNHRQNMKIEVKRVETTDEELYRQV